MIKNFCHLVYVPFTGLGLKDGFRGDEWYRYRIKIFKDYTLKSLLNQTNRNFITWISFRPQEKFNPLTWELYEYMSKLRDYPFVFTFGGLCFYDDKFKDEENLLKRLELTLPNLREVCEGKKWVLETLAPSDDMFHKDEMEEVQECVPLAKKAALTHDKGFLFNQQSQRLAEWNPTTNPPFYTLIYPKEIFLDPQKHFEYMAGFKSHEDIVRLFNCFALPDRRYCVLVHKKNISTNWWHPFRGKVFSWREGKEILKDFGIEIETPSAISGGMREMELIAKRLVKRWMLRLLMKVGLYNYVKRAFNAFQRSRFYPNK